jgi:hypothetical protein
VNPEFITDEHIALAIQALIHNREIDTNSHIELGPFRGGIEIIHEHEHMPSKVEWAAKIHVRNLADPLWASYTRDYGVDVVSEKLYWLTESWQEVVQ